MLWQSNRSYEESRESIVAVDVGLAYWVSGADKSRRCRLKSGIEGRIISVFAVLSHIEISKALCVDSVDL